METLSRLFGVALSGAALVLCGSWAMIIWGVVGGGLGGTDMSNHDLVVLEVVSLGSTVVFAVTFTIVTVRFVRWLTRTRDAAKPGPTIER